MPVEPERLRIALLTYRGNPHSGGQGVYVRYLSRALADLGHEVEVFSGQPYPELQDGVALTRLPSLDLYNAADPFRRPKRHEFRDWIDALEYGSMCSASFPEPLTFSLRAAREFKRNRPFDVIHDNQSLGYGLLQMQKRSPVIATVHHPCSIDRDLQVAHTARWDKRMGVRRWYSFTTMQGRVARRLPRVITVSDHARNDVVREFRVPAPNISVIHNGVDQDLFRPLDQVARVPGRIVTTASASVPLKGLVYLVEAVAKLRTERDVELVVIGKPGRDIGRTLDRFGVADHVRFETGVDWARLVELYAEAEVAVVPSLYEGFSLPAIEAMSCGVPLVATTGGALPEVAGPDGEAAALVPPGDPGALAAAIGKLLDDPALRQRTGEAGRRRVLDRFTWKQAAAATVDEYRSVIDAHR